MKSLTTFVLVLFAAVASSQVVKKPGMLLLNDSTKLTGYIDYNDWDESPQNITYYKDSLSKQGLIYNISEVQYFEVFGYEAYLRIPFHKYCKKVPERFLRQPELAKRLRTDNAFVLLLVVGPYSLAKYRHEEHDHYLLRYLKSEWEELRNKDVFDDQGKLIESATVYRSQLVKYLAAGNFSNEQRSLLIKAIEQLPFDKVADVINEFNTGKTAYRQPRIKDAVSWYAHLGISPGFSQVQFADHLKPVHGPIGGVHAGFDIRCNDFVNGLMGRVSFDFGNYFYPNLYFNTYGYSVSLGYSLLLRGTNRVYAGGGISFYDPILSRAARAHLQSNLPYMFVDAWITGYARMGFIWKNGWEIAASKEILNSLNSPMRRHMNPNNFNIHFIRHLDLEEKLKRSSKRHGQRS